MLGFSLDESSFEDTPNRYAKFLLDFVPKLKTPPKFTTFPTDNNEGLIVVKGLQVRSMCAHHLAPFFGTCTIVYKPNSKMAGLSKFQRVLDYLCQQPTEQETLTKIVRDYLVTALDTENIFVEIDCVHTCMVVRGVQNPTSTTKTALGIDKFNYQELMIALSNTK